MNRRLVSVAALVALAALLAAWSAGGAAGASGGATFTYASQNSIVTDFDPQALVEEALRLDSGNPVGHSLLAQVQDRERQALVDALDPLGRGIAQQSPPSEHGHPRHRAGDAVTRRQSSHQTLR